MKCPSCRKEISLDAIDHPACGWTLTGRHGAPCAVPGCLAPASGMYCPTHAREQRDAQAQTEADAYCGARGLVTPEAKRRFVHTLFQTFGRMTFARWADTITQVAVDRLLMLDSRDTLRRLQTRGVVDESYRVIPPENRHPASTRIPGEDDE